MILSPAQEASGTNQNFLNGNERDTIQKKRDADEKQLQRNIERLNTCGIFSKNDLSRPKHTWLIS